MKTDIKHLYVHVPFCKTICAYCDFCRVVYREDLVNHWLERLVDDFLNFEEEYETIYIGGGTPNCLNYEQLKKLLEIIKPFSKQVIEYTIEINPECMDHDKLALIKSYGINRVSIGLQSSENHLLKLMNRHHNFGDVSYWISCFKNTGINNISLDIIYSLPNQTMNDLQKTLDKVIDLDVSHLSLYSLTIEENSAFNKLGYTKLDDEIEADMYEYIEKRLSQNDFIHYEVANFCKKGFESKHNMGYWRYEDFRGIGCGASGKIGNVRYDVTANLINYIDNKDVIYQYELEIKEVAFEHLMMSLRTGEGLDLLKYQKLYNIDFLNKFQKELLKYKDCFVVENNHLICTKLSMLNSILIDFMDYK